MLHSVSFSFFVPFGSASSRRWVATSQKVPVSCPLSLDGKKKSNTPRVVCSFHLQTCVTADALGNFFWLGFTHITEPRPIQDRHETDTIEMELEVTGT